MAMSKNIKWALGIVAALVVGSPSSCIPSWS